MLTIYVKNNKTLTEVLRDYDLILSREIIERVCQAIDEDLPSILVATFVVPGSEEPFDIHSSRKYYKKALEVNMQKIADETEEYELCAKAKHYMNKLDLIKKSNKKKK